MTLTLVCSFVVTLVNKSVALDRYKIAASRLHFENIGGNMRSILAVAAFVGLGTIALAQQTTVASNAPQSKSKLEIVGGETYDWGKTKPPADGHLEAKIQMKNSGTVPMKIIEVKPGCGCTKTDPDKYEVEPNDMSTMGVKLNISPAQSGQITKSITIRWMDQNAYDAREAFRKNQTAVPAGLDTVENTTFLFLKADIVRAISMTPSIYFSFQGLEVGKTGNTTVTLHNNSDQPVTFSDWSTDNGLVVNQSGSVTVKPGGTLDVVGTVVPSQKGQYSALMKCKTSHPEHAALEIRAYGFVKESASPVFQQPK